MDERERQRRHRAVRREAASRTDGPTAAPCHAPAPADTLLEFQDIFDQLADSLADSLAELSRTTLGRQGPEIARAIARRVGRQDDPVSPGHAPA